MLFILDRDGVINADPGYISQPDNWDPIPGSLEAIATLNQAGHTVTVATNQSGLGRGLITEKQLHYVHQKMQDQLSDLGGHIDGIYYCPHRPDEGCNCRKPNTGMLDKIFKDFEFAPENSWFIGDSLSDLQAGEKAGCQVALVLTGYGQKTLKQLTLNHTIPIFNNLSHGVERILQEAKA